MSFENLLGWKLNVCSRSIFKLHAALGGGFSLTYHWNFPSAPGDVASHPVTMLSREGAASVYTTHVFHCPKHHQYNKTNLLEVVCLFVFLSRCFPCCFCILQVTDSITLSSPCCNRIFGLFQARPCFSLEHLKRVIWKLHEQKKKLGVSSREVPVLNCCLPNTNVSYYRALVVREVFSLGTVVLGPAANERVSVNREQKGRKLKHSGLLGWQVGISSDMTQALP